MKIRKLFPTSICQGTLKPSAELNKKLLKEIKELSAQDRMGREWSKQNYRGGYTSYASLSDLHHRSRIFSDFEQLLQPFAEEFARALEWEMRGMDLVMTACWMNVMPKHVYHTLHLHPHSVLSGAYYVRCPKGSVALKLEDPRMGFYMNAPLRKARTENALYSEIVPTEGSFVFFESWMRHEVPPNQSNDPRVSLSFNYALEARE